MVQSTKNKTGQRFSILGEKKGSAKERSTDVATHGNPNAETARIVPVLVSWMGKEENNEDWEIVDPQGEQGDWVKI